MKSVSATRNSALFAGVAWFGWLSGCGGVEAPGASALENGGASSGGGVSSGGGGSAGSGAHAGSGGGGAGSSGNAGAAGGSGGNAGSSATGGSGGSSGASGANGGAGGVPLPPDLDGPPFTTKADLFEQDDPEDLGLSKAPGTETVTIFAPNDETDHFSNGVVLTAFKGYLYAQWQSSPKDEDSPDTWTAYSRSTDGKSWSAPAVLAESGGDQHGSGGWWVAGDTLVAYINVYPTGDTPRGGYTEFKTSSDGVNFSAAKKLPLGEGGASNGIFEQDPRALPDGRILGAAHFAPGLMVAPCYTDDPSGTAGWVRAPFPSLSNDGAVTREIEPSWFLRADGAIVMVFRDQDGSYRKLASMSGDRGATWTTPVLTDMPDSRAKQSAGNLPDGTAFQVNNPVTTNRRSPLVVTLSRDGHYFDKAFALRLGGNDLQAQRYTGKAKTLGYSYPKSLVHDGFLYVGYSVNKEDVAYTRVPLASLAY